MGKGRKGRKQDDDWENDLDEIAKESGITLGGDASEDFEIPVTKKKEKKTKKKKGGVENEDSDVDDDDKEIATLPTKGPKNKPSFNALLLADNDSGDDVPSDRSDEEIVKTVPKEKSKKLYKQDDSKDNIEHEENGLEVTQEKKKGKGKKKEKPKKKEDEDIDALLADIELSEKKEPEGKKSKKKGKKKALSEEDTEMEKVNENANKTITDDIDMKVSETKGQEGDKKETKVVNDVDEDMDEGPKIKTAAQKKAEKKEREKQKREAQKAAAKREKEKKESASKSAAEKSASMDEKIQSTDAMATDDQVTAEAEPTVAMEIFGEGNEDKGESGESDAEEEGKDKKKKKKKKKKGEEEKPKKKLGKAAVKKMQELLEKKKEEEERLRQEEEAKIKALEEAENRRLEKLRLEQERKEKRKQKEKERKERLKREGKLLTPQQKEAKRKAELMLLAMKEQGIEVPCKDKSTTGEKKKVMYVTKRNKKQKVEEKDAGKAAEDSPPTDESLVATTQEVEKKEVEKPKEEEPKESKDDETPDSWDQLIEDDDVKHSWDAENEDEEPVVETKLGLQEKEKQATQNTEKAAEVVAVKQESIEEEREKSSDENEESEEESSSSEEEEEESSEEESESEDERITPEKIKERAKERIRKRREKAEAERTTEKLRCPVICVLGHVDTGKTKILDKIRHTNVQDGEAGGITQQIGATLVPFEAIKEQTKMVKEFQKYNLRLPGLLIIDTPGHESFSNLRTRGSSLCDMAILVVDIMHGLEPQTLESISLLRKKHTPFVVALNKVDRLFEWKRGPGSQVEDTIKKQKKNTKLEFEERMQHIIGEFAEQGLNAAPFYKNMDEKVYISLVPTSAHSGDGMGDLMALICKLTQNRLAKKLAFSEEIQSTVMEVKALPGLGTTIDVILVNGRLREGDTIVTGGLEGPIVTQVRALLTPQPLRELRVKSQYIPHKEIEAAQGVKLTGKDLEKVMAGAPLFVAGKEDEIEVYKDEVTEIVSSTLQAIKVSDRGVYVQASTLGSLEALLEFLKTSKIPYSGVNIGPVHKKDVMRSSVMLEHEKMFAVILAFDVKVERDAQEFADKEGVKIFTADIIYHLFDKFTGYTEEYKQKKREEFKHIAIFPCKLRVMPQHIFNTRDPIVIGVHVEGGNVRLGTPLVVPSKEFVEIGIVTGIEANHKQMEKAATGQEVCVKIEPVPGEAPKMFGRHFTHEDLIMSKINREAIDALKNYFREEMQKSDWQLIIEMKKIFGIL